MSENIMETIEYNGYNIDIIPDSDCESPLDAFDNLGKMVCFHSRHNLGDEHEYSADDFDGWDDIEKHIDAEVTGGVISLPLYLYDHSGITMNTTGFSCGWDSGQVGFIYIPKSQVREEYGVKRISRKMRERICGYLKKEVETYDAFISGAVYGYQVTDSDGEELDSCWGFYGDDYENNGIMEDAKPFIDGTIKERSEFALRS